MIERVKRAWCSALRSGAYSQGVGRLRLTARHHDGTQEHYHCCLGVLLDVIDPDGWGDNDRHYTKVNGNEICQDLILDNPVLIALDMAQEDMETLAEMNDSAYDFEHIANYIEANL